jgi:hypothetical protein
MSAKSKSSPAKIKEIERQAAALNLRRAGAGFEEIARQLKYADASGAYKAFQAALDKTLREPSEAARKMELERCDRLMLSYWQRANNGDAEALDRVLKIMAHRAKLEGLFAPKAVNFTDADGKTLPIQFIEIVLSDGKKLNGTDPS